jgi:agmatine deiminase
MSAIVGALVLGMLSSLMPLSIAGDAQADPAGHRSPQGPVRMCAEWEPAHGTLIRWPLGIPSSLVVELAADDSLYVLVETSGQENQATSTFQAWGVNMGHVRFIRANTYSHWTRDWGPQGVFDGNGELGITDPIFDGYPWVAGCFMDAGDQGERIAAGRPAVYDAPEGGRGYEEDDAVNAVLAAELGCPLHEMPAYCTGGNIMTDGHGIAFSTRRMINENGYLWTEEEFRQLAETFLGISDYRIVDDPEINGIQHIDCHAKLLDEETVLVKRVVLTHPEYDCVERLAEQIAAQPNCYGRPYNVVRIECPNYEPNRSAAYTNSLILNRKVLVPLFGLSSDAAALATYSQAMPGYEVIGFPWSAWYYYDALHCRTMGIFDPHMLRITHRRLDAEQPQQGAYEILATIDDRSEAGLLLAELHVYWQILGAAEWAQAPLIGVGGDEFRAEIPWQPVGATVAYYLAAADASGRQETLPRTAPTGYYQFTVTDNPAGIDAPADLPMLALHPTIGAGDMRLELVLPHPGPLSVDVFDLGGRRLTTLSRGLFGAGAHMLHWNGADDRGRACPGGMYLIRASTPAGTVQVRFLRLR